MPHQKVDKNAAMEIGLRIKMARLRADLTQDDAIKKLGWPHQSRLSQYERGSRRLSQDVINELAKAFDVSPNWLLTGHNGGSLKGARIEEDKSNSSDLLARCISQVKEEADRQGLQLSDEQIARVASTIYVEVKGGESLDKADLSAAVRFVHKFN